jgi:uncharacterized protein YcbX
MTGRVTEIGRVTELWRYPIKSMAAEPLDEVDVSWHGLAGDRRWAFIRDSAAQSGFPWLTLRQRNDMGLYRPSFVDPKLPDSSVTVVRSPSGESFDVTDPALASELFPKGARVVRHDRGVFDAFPISLISTQSVERLGEMVGDELDVSQFRPNIVMTATNGTPFFEDSLVGTTVRVGGTRMRVDKRDGRCVVITIDPVSRERNPAVLRAVASERDGCLGVYGSVVEPGRIAVGDPIVLEGSAIQ